MIRHCSLFTWIDGITDDQREAVRDGLDALRAAVPEIVRFAHGPDIGVTDGNAAYAVVADFATVEHFLAYRDHPEHQRLLVETIRPVLAARASVQFEVDEADAG